MFCGSLILIPTRTMRHTKKGHENFMEVSRDSVIDEISWKLEKNCTIQLKRWFMFILHIAVKPRIHWTNIVRKSFETIIRLKNTIWDTWLANRHVKFHSHIARMLKYWSTQTQQCSSILEFTPEMKAVLLLANKPFLLHSNDYVWKYTKVNISLLRLQHSLLESIP